MKPEVAASVFDVSRLWISLNCACRSRWSNGSLSALFFDACARYSTTSFSSFAISGMTSRFSTCRLMAKLAS